MARLLGIVETDELVDQALGMNPTECMLADPELARAVGDDHGIIQQTVMVDAAPKAALGGDLDGIGRDIEPIDSERTQMRQEGFAIGERLVVMRLELSDHRPSQRAPRSVGQF